MYVFGICGRSGSGKSTVCRFLQNRGFYWLDTDKTCREVYDKSAACVEELRHRFGDEILSDGKINRKALAKAAFASEENSKALNEISHRYIIEEMHKEMEKAQESGIRYLLLDAPLLFEAGLEKECDATVAVVASGILSECRLKARDGIDAATVKKRLAAQKSASFLAENCDAVILNKSDLKALETNTFKAFFALFLKLRICKTAKERQRYVKK